MRGLLLAAGLCVLFGVAACTGDQPAEQPSTGAPVIQPGKPGEPNKTLSPGEASTAVPKGAPNDADFNYVQGMIVHHGQAIEMTDLAAQFATGAQVKELATRIAAGQNPEIAMMNKWLVAKGKPEIDPRSPHAMHMHGPMPGMATPAQMDQLRAARGLDFDKLFLQLMITHHEGALAMARELQGKGVDVKAQEMADEVIATQSAEIKRMKGMLAV